MTATGDDSKIATPFMPSLFHLSLIKIAIPLFNEFDLETWKKASLETKRDKSKENNQSTEQNRKVNNAKRKLLLIPALFRDDVITATLGLHWAASKWRSDHMFVRSFNEDPIFYWRSDGTIDRIKIAQQFVLNTNIQTSQRFELACSYFMEKSVKTLWAEMVGPDESFVLPRFYSPICFFWVDWMQRGTLPWMQALQEYNPQRNFSNSLSRFSVLFPSLQPKDREKFFHAIIETSSDDFRFCLYAVTKEEEGKILRIKPRSLLLLYLDWPFQGLFLETADKMWNIITYDDFKTVLRVIRFFSLTRHEFDFGKLLTDFWDRSPAHFKHAAGSYFEEVKNKQFTKCDVS